MTLEICRNFHVSIAIVKNTDNANIIEPLKRLFSFFHFNKKKILLNNLSKCHTFSILSILFFFSFTKHLLWQCSIVDATSLPMKKYYFLLHIHSRKEKKMCIWVNEERRNRREEPVQKPFCVESPGSVWTTKHTHTQTFELSHLSVCEITKYVYTKEACDEAPSKKNKNKKPK